MADNVYRIHHNIHDTLYAENCTELQDRNMFYNFVYN